MHCAKKSLELRLHSEKNDCEAVRSHRRWHAERVLTFEMLCFLIPARIIVSSGLCLSPNPTRTFASSFPLFHWPSTRDIPLVSRGPAQMPPPASFQEGPCACFYDSRVWQKGHFDNSSSEVPWSIQCLKLALLYVPGAALEQRCDENQGSNITPGFGSRFGS